MKLAIVKFNILPEHDFDVLCKAYEIFTDEEPGLVGKHRIDGLVRLGGLYSLEEEAGKIKVETAPYHISLDNTKEYILDLDKLYAFGFMGAMEIVKFIDMEYGDTVEP